MSIGQFLASYVATRELQLVPHARGETVQREVYATRCVWDMLNTWEDTRLGQRHARARVHVDTFTEGLKIAVRFPPSKSIAAHTALLTERSEEVWEMRARDPSPGIRIFGRFLRKDRFVALTWDYKENSETPEQYEYQKGRCSRAWSALFVSMLPYTGANVHEYVTNCIAV